MLKKRNADLLFWWAIALILLIPCIDIENMVNHFNPREPMPIQCYPLVVGVVLMFLNVSYPVAFGTLFFSATAMIYTLDIVVSIVYAVLVTVVAVFLVLYFKKERNRKRLCFVSTRVALGCILLTVIDSVVLFAFSTMVKLALGQFWVYWALYLVASVAFIVSAFRYRVKKEEAVKE